MSKTSWTKADLAEDLELLLGDLCVKWGFCNRLSGEDLVRDHQPLTGEDFARSILTAEGMNPEYEIAWLRQIKQRFTDRYGDTVSTRIHALRAVR